VRSTRAYLLLRLVGGASVVLAAAGLAVYLAVTHDLEKQFDRNLSDRVVGLASLLFQQEQHVEFEFSDQLMPDYERPERPAYFELRFADGRLLERSNSLGGDEDEGDGEFVDLEVPVAVGPAPVHWTAPLPDGREGRYVAQLVEVHHVYPEEGPDRPEAARLSIVVARGVEDLIAAERTVLRICLLVSVAMIVLLAVLARLAVDRALEPTRRLVTGLDAVEVSDLPERFHVGELPPELSPVADKVNALIRRVERALQRERRTAADIAHELRTPISELITVAEVSLRNGTEPGSDRAALCAVRDAAWRMARSVSTLLKLARLEMGAESFANEPIELRGLLAEVLGPLTVQARARALAIDDEVPDEARIRGDRDALRIVLSNLVGNAVEEAPPGSTVTLRLDASRAGWRFVVGNPVTGLDPADLEALTEPFWRKDHARADGNRSGLGLALSLAIAERTGLELGFELDGGTFRATLAGPPANGAS